MRQRELVLHNIAEAREQLEDIERSLRSAEYGEIELKLELEHAYHHLNYAWNIRNEDDAALAAHSTEDFAKWSRFPLGEILAYE